MVRIITLCVFLFFHFQIKAQQYYSWATGYSGKILNTTNGGTDWSSQSSVTTNDLYSVSFVNSTTGWIVGWSGKILKTTNVGSNWISQTSGTTNDLRSI